MARYLALLPLAVLGQNWCGQPECAARPQCSNTAVDIIMALDQSCSMQSSDFILEGNFSRALAAAAEQRFNISRFAGIQFGFATNLNSFPIAKSSKIFAHMQPGAAAFSASVPVPDPVLAWNPDQCGGTPMDEALDYFYQELNSTRVPDRMQVAILMTDGEPTLCWTAGGYCTGKNGAANIVNATSFSIIERWRPNKLPSLGALFFSIGIGSQINATVLTNFSSSPRMYFLATDFTSLVTTTLPQVLDQLCFYAITGNASCTGATQLHTIKAYNFFPLSGTPKCRFQEIGTSNYYYSDASISITSETFLNESGIVSYVTCNDPNVTYDFAALLEISREGVYYTTNELSATVRRQCNATSTPLCPGAAIQAFFAACAESQFSGNSTQCNATCAAASVELGNAFVSSNYLFDAKSISDCLLGAPGTYSVAARTLVANLTKPGTGPCPAATNPATSGAAALFAFSCASALMLASL